MRRGAKITAKNLNVNYQVAQRGGAAADGHAGRDRREERAGAAARDLWQHSVKLIDLFREWDEDGNGALDKKEVRRAVAALGYEAPRSEVDALFDSIDVDGAADRV